MLKFKLLAGALVVGLIAWFGWWWIAAGAQEAALERWLADRRAAGWQAEAAEISVRGFPNRLDVKLTAPALADPASGWAWSAPRFDIRQVIYDPTFFVAEWPAEQRVAEPGARATLRAEVMEASLKVDAKSSLDLARASADIQRGAVAADAGWTASVARLTAHVRAAPEAGPDNAYEFRLDGLGLRLPNFLRDALDPAGALPPAMETVALEGRAALDRRLDRFSFEGPKPQLVALSLKEMRAKWGGLGLTVSGSMTADENGYGAGAFDITAENWKAMLDAASAAGAIKAGLLETLKTGLGFIARLSGDPDRLDVTLTLEGGYARIGPVPVGRAPLLAAR